MAGRNQRYRPDAPIVAELASGAVVTSSARGPHELLLLHLTKEDRWCLPKGHVEAGESLRAAAEREVREESGLEGVAVAEELRTVQYRFYSPEKRSNILKTVVYFVARAPHRELRLEPLFDRGIWASASEGRRLVRFTEDRSVIRAFERWSAHAAAGGAVRGGKPG